MIGARQAHVHRLLLRLAVIAAVVVCAILSLGCASAPSAPVSKVFASESAITELEMPLPAPPRPTAAVVQAAGAEMMCFDEAGARQLLGREEVLAANTQIAADAVNAYAALRDAHHVQHQHGQILEAQYNATAQRLAAAEAQLERERREAMLERWLARALLIVAIGASL